MSVLEPSWLSTKRQQAKNIFESEILEVKKDSPTGVYTDVAKLPSIASKYETKPATIELIGLSQEDKAKGVIFCDFEMAKKVAPHLLETHLNKIIEVKDKLISMHVANAQSGILLYVPKGIEIKNKLTAKIQSPYSLASVYVSTIVIMEDNSKAQYFEEFVSDREDIIAYHSEISEVFLSSSANLTYTILSSFSNNVTDFSKRRAQVGSNSQMTWIVGQFGSNLNFSSYDAILNGQGAMVGNFGIFFGIGKQHFDITADAFHRVPNTSNSILWYGVNSNKSTSVFRGMIEIDNIAAQTSTTMNQYTLLLSKQARSNTIPSLAIKTNDVMAKHGTSVGQINEEHIFYLMTRGLSRDEAKQQIIEGFFDPILSKISDLEIKEKFENLTTNYMKKERETIE